MTLRSARVGGFVEIHVIDEGPGMTEEERRDAFAPFWQSATGRRTQEAQVSVSRSPSSSPGRVKVRSVSIPSPRGGIDAVVRFRADEDVKGRVSSGGSVTSVSS